MEAGEFYATGSATPWQDDKIDSDDEEEDEDYEDFRIDSDDEEELDRMSINSHVGNELPSSLIKTSTLVNVTFYDYPDSKRMDR